LRLSTAEWLVRQEAHFNSRTAGHPVTFRVDFDTKLDESRLNGSNTRPFAAAFSAPACKHKGRVAQLVEQGIENPRVGGSIPSPATIACSSIKIVSQGSEYSAL
jgi:hypothetical protein